MGNPILIVWEVLWIRFTWNCLVELSVANHLLPSGEEIIGMAFVCQSVTFPPEPFERFSLNFYQRFISMRWSAELMTRIQG